MSFHRTMKRANALEQMEQRAALAELAEARAVFVTACYEAVYGPLAPDFFKEVQELIKDGQPKTKGEFYQQVYGAAKTVQVDREYEAASAMVENPAEPTEALREAMAAVTSAAALGPVSEALPHIPSNE